MKIKEFLKKFTIANYIYLACAYIIIILGFIISDDKNILSLIASLMGVTAFLMSAKGFTIAPILSSIYYILYASLALTQKFYGEAIVNGLISLPLSVFAIVTWFRNKNKSENTNVSVNEISKKEYLYLFLALPVVYVGMFFLLKALDTNQLIINSISTLCCICAGYLLVRRSPFYSLAYICADVVVITLWSVTIMNEGLAYLPTLLSVCCFFVNDIYGLYSWQKRRKIQKESEENQTEDVAK